MANKPPRNEDPPKSFHEAVVRAWWQHPLGPKLFRAAGVIFILLFIVGAAKTFVLQSPQEPEIGQTVFDLWKRNNQQFITKHGEPGSPRKTKVWVQVFAKGLIAVLPEVGKQFIFCGENGGPVQVEDSSLADGGGMITGGPGNSIVMREVTEPLLAAITNQTEKAEYTRLVYDQFLKGGIGTTYLKNQLLPKLGRPQHKDEAEYSDTMYARDGLEYAMLIAMPNGVSSITDSDARSHIRSVYVVFHQTNLFKKFEVDTRIMNPQPNHKKWLGLDRDLFSMLSGVLGVLLFFLASFLTKRQ